MLPTWLPPFWVTIHMHWALGAVDGGAGRRWVMAEMPMALPAGCPADLSPTTMLMGSRSCGTHHTLLQNHPKISWFEASLSKVLCKSLKLRF